MKEINKYNNHQLHSYFSTQYYHYLDHHNSQQWYKKVYKDHKAMNPPNIVCFKSFFCQKVILDDVVISRNNPVNTTASLFAHHHEHMPVINKQLRYSLEDVVATFSVCCYILNVVRVTWNLPLLLQQYPTETTFIVHLTQRTCKLTKTKRKETLWRQHESFKG